MAAKKFILLNTSASIPNPEVSPFIVIDSELLKKVVLYSEVVSLNDQLFSNLIVDFSVSESSPFSDFFVEFDATTNLFDGIRFYVDILKQLDLLESDYQLEDFVPSELRHLIDKQPEVLGRP